MPGMMPSPLPSMALGDAHSCAHLIHENIEAPLNHFLELFGLNSEEPRLQSRLPDSRTSRPPLHSVYFPFVGNSGDSKLAIYLVSMHPSLWN